eukprot:m.290305 g.290305  ORF g.290305 m.290305 type:complete len:75 (-) comp17804_c0_seq15:2712-2936(-)
MSALKASDPGFTGACAVCGVQPVPFTPHHLLSSSVNQWLHSVFHPRSPSAPSKPGLCCPYILLPANTVSTANQT